MSEDFETMNMPSVSIETVTRLIKEQLEDNDLKPVLGIGKTGIGKTESISALCRELKIGFKEMRLVTMNETDLLGIPDYVEREDKSGNKYKSTTFASNDMLPYEDRDGTVGILCLDEITSASKTIRAAAYQLLDEKRGMGNYKLPDNWLVVALGNGPDDGGVFAGMEHAVLSRCRCYRVEPELKSWRDWAIKNGVNASVIAFLGFQPEYLHKLPDDTGVPQVFPNPRSWASLSRKLNDRERRKGGVIDNELIVLYAGAEVGREVAVKFATFYAYNKQTIRAEEVVDGKVDIDRAKKCSTEAIRITIESVIKYLGSCNKTDDKSEFIRKVANAIRFFIELGNGIRLDLAVMGVSGVATIDYSIESMLLDGEDEFNELCPEYEIFIAKNANAFGG